MFKLELKRLFREKVILLLAVGGISLAILLVIILQGILKGTVHVAGEFSRSVGADIFVAQDGVENMIAGSSTISKDTIDELDGINGIDSYYPIYGTLYSFDVGKSKIAAYIIGYDLDNDLGKPWSLSSGRNIKSDNEIVVDKTMASINHIKINDKVKLSGNEFKVVGLSNGTNSLGSQYVFITDDAAVKILGSDLYYNYVLVKTKSDVVAKDVVSDINKKCDSLDAFTKETFASNNEQCLYEIMQLPMNMMIYIGVFISIIISGMCLFTFTSNNIANYVMLCALGARRADVKVSLMVDTFILNLFSFVMAVILSVILKVAIDGMGLTVSLRFSYEIFVFAGITTLCASICTLIFPFRQISKINPAEVYN